MFINNLHLWFSAQPVRAIFLFFQAFLFVCCHLNGLHFQIALAVSVFDLPAHHWQIRAACAVRGSGRLGRMKRERAREGSGRAVELRMLLWFLLCFPLLPTRLWRVTLPHHSSASLGLQAEFSPGVLDLAYTVCSSLIFNWLSTFKFGDISQKIITFLGGKGDLKILVQIPNELPNSWDERIGVPHWLGQGTSISILSLRLPLPIVFPTPEPIGRCHISSFVKCLAFLIERGDPFGLRDSRCVVLILLANDYDDCFRDKIQTE